MFNWLSQIVSVTHVNLRSIPARKGAALAAAVGIAGVVAVFVGVLSIAEGFRAAMKITGGAPLPQIPLKGDYARRDFVRSAKFHGVPFRIPSSFPISTIAAVRAFYWAQGQDPARAVALARALYQAYFGDDIDISRVEEVIRVAAGAGFRPEQVAAGVADQAVKDRTKAEVDAAIAKGVFGSPFIVIDNEAFWGMHRFDQIEKWLTSGGW